METAPPPTIIKNTQKIIVIVLLLVLTKPLLFDVHLMDECPVRLLNVIFVRF